MPVRILTSRCIQFNTLTSSQLDESRATGQVVVSRICAPESRTRLHSSGRLWRVYTRQGRGAGILPSTCIALRAPNHQDASGGGGDAAARSPQSVRGRSGRGNKSLRPLQPRRLTGAADAGRRRCGRARECVSVRRSSGSRRRCGGCQLVRGCMWHATNKDTNRKEGSSYGSEGEGPRRRRRRGEGNENQYASKRGLRGPRVWRAWCLGAHAPHGGHCRRGRARGALAGRRAAVGYKKASPLSSQLAPFPSSHVPLPAFLHLAWIGCDVPFWPRRCRC